MKMNFDKFLFHRKRRKFYINKNKIDKINPKFYIKVTQVNYLLKFTNLYIEFNFDLINNNENILFEPKKFKKPNTSVLINETEIFDRRISNSLKLNYNNLYQFVRDFARKCDSK